jgi:membrane-bound serine protease (ClpP class)
MIRASARLLLALLAMVACIATPNWATAATDTDSTVPGTTAAAQGPRDTAAAVPDPGKVGYASLTGPIDRLRHRYLDRVVERARQLKLDTLILHIDTDGGAVSHAREMFKTVLAQSQDGPRMIAFVDFRAISAGALVSYAHDAIYISESASIGDIGVIFISSDGEIKYAPEKIETVVRSQLAQAAEVRGWDRALLLKMTARTQKLYNITTPDGKSQYVIEDDLPAFLAAHPKVDMEDRTQAYVYRGEDRLLTLTGTEAVALGMATGSAENIESLYDQLGIESSGVIDLTPRFAERTAWSLAPLAPLLAGLAVLFILFEIKTPGVGIWALIGAICGAGFLLSQYYLDMAENMEIIILLVGVALLAIDALLGIAGGALAAAGFAMVLTGLALSFLPNELEFDFSDPIVGAALRDAALSTLLSISVVGIGFAAFARLVPGSAIARRMALTAEVEAVVASGPSHVGNGDGNDSWLGQNGHAVGALHPAGLVELEGHRLSARAEGGKFISPGAAVRVVGEGFGEIVVRPVEDDSLVS